MGQIQVLSEQLANQIAAGEVVERPASVVKELVENSIDAGSKRIDIWLEESGLKLIRVLDQGAGIEVDDCELAFLRHATSKIKTSRDLTSIRTLGFRGEALSSIASVSRFTCITSATDNGLGHKLQIEAGKLVTIEEVSATRGTDMLVMDLFYQTPARLKYMKSLQTELSHISDFVNRIALARPDIAFSLRHENHLLLQSYGQSDALQVIAAIYGTSIASQMVMISGESLDYQISGYVGKPEITRANRNGMTFIINGRVVRSIALQQAILQGYHTLLPIHRYPIAVISISMDPTLVDVNVHPAKLEVRFSKEQELIHLLETAIRNAFQQQVFIPQISKPNPERESFIQEQLPMQRPAHSSSQKKDREVPIPKSETTSSTYRYPDRTEGSSQQWINSFAVRESQPVIALPTFPQLSIIGQMQGTYIVAQNEQGLYLIDQHAAHERVHYELFMEKFASSEQANQPLLIPITLQFTFAEANIIREKLVFFEQVGIELEPFGQQAFLARSYPHWFPAGDEQSVLEEMCEWVLQDKKSIQLMDFREKFAILCACKASIKANQAISIAQLETLLDRLAACKNPYTCPHGRPIVVSFSTYELEKMFKRVM